MWSYNYGDELSHAFGSGRQHKYIAKIGNRYFYTPAELKAFRDQTTSNINYDNTNSRTLYGKYSKAREMIPTNTDEVKKIRKNRKEAGKEAFKDREYDMREITNNRYSSSEGNFRKNRSYSSSSMDSKTIDQNKSAIADESEHTNVQTTKTTINRKNGTKKIKSETVANQKHNNNNELKSDRKGHGKSKEVHVVDKDGNLKRSRTVTKGYYVGGNGVEKASDHYTDTYTTNGRTYKKKVDRYVNDGSTTIKTRTHETAKSRVINSAAYNDLQNHTKKIKKASKFLSK